MLYRIVSFVTNDSVAHKRNNLALIDQPNFKFRPFAKFWVPETHGSLATRIGISSGIDMIVSFCFGISVSNIFAYAESCQPRQKIPNIAINLDHSSKELIVPAKFP